MINRGALSELLIGFFTGKEKTTTQLVAFIKLNKTLIYHAHDVPKKNMGTIHSLCLQLVAIRIIELGITADKRHLVGKQGVLPKNVTVQLGMDRKQPTILIDSYWERVSL
jgi:hypothetical protein